MASSQPAARAPRKRGQSSRNRGKRKAYADMRQSFPPRAYKVVPQPEQSGVHGDTVVREVAELPGEEQAKSLVQIRLGGFPDCLHAGVVPAGFNLVGEEHDALQNAHSDVAHGV